jgi:prolipoprotein diacylglyceryltransferase
MPWGVSLPKFGTYLPGIRPDTQFPSDAWIWSVAQGFTDPSATRSAPLHPVQLYEAAGDLLLAGLVILLARRLAATNGPWAQAGWLHIGGYSLLRFGLEFLHGDRDASLWAGMTALQLGLLACLVLAIVTYVKNATRAAA